MKGDDRRRRVCELQTLKPARLLCPWNSPGKDTGASCHFLLQRIFRIQRSSLSLRSLALAAGFFTTSATWEAHTLRYWACQMLPYELWEGHDSAQQHISKEKIVSPITPTCPCFSLFCVAFYRSVYMSSTPQTLSFLRSEATTFLVAQWLSLCLPMQGTQVQSLVLEDSTCCWATKPMHYNY